MGSAIALNTVCARAFIRVPAILFKHSLNDTDLWPEACVNPSGVRGMGRERNAGRSERKSHFDEPNVTRPFAIATSDCYGPRIDWRASFSSRTRPLIAAREATSPASKARSQVDGLQQSRFRFENYLEPALASRTAAL